MGMASSPLPPLSTVLPCASLPTKPLYLPPPFPSPLPTSSCPNDQWEGGRGLAVASTQLSSSLIYHVSSLGQGQNLGGWVGDDCASCLVFCPLKQGRESGVCLPMHGV